MTRKILRITLFFFLSITLLAQGPRFSRDTRSYILYDAETIALKNVRLVKGDGSNPIPGQTVIIHQGRISGIGDSGTVQIPEGAEVLDLSGKTLLPGFIMFHEHMFYPAGNGHYNQQSISFPRLYLAGGVTFIRTAGSMEPYSDLNLKKNIEAGRTPGPRMDVTSPYFNGPGLGILSVKALTGADDARKMVDYWDYEGVDSFKVYAQISRADLAVVVEEAHRRGKKVTGHLGAVTYREAADRGIDNLEHGFFTSSDFVLDKKEDRGPNARAQRESLLKLDPDGPEFQSLVRHLITKGVALTSTLPVFETMTPGRPVAPDAVLETLLPETRDLYLRSWSRIAGSSNSSWPALLKKGMELERRFFAAGGLLLVGTDPTGYGGVVAGHSNLRALELLVEAGLSPLEAIQVATLNGARYLDVDDELGTIEVGKIGDLIVVNGDPAAKIGDIRKIELVFKDGIGYDSKKLFASVKGTVGLR